MRSRQRSVIIGCSWFSLLLIGASVQAQDVEVTAHVSVVDKTASARHKAAPSSAEVVLWLSPLQPGGRSAAAGHPGPFRLVQKDKTFIPHLLVVPKGSRVEFPNQDPFFHNVFSLFNGKRFDLGLYESGSSRSVPFDTEGISYIFCNIHPEMGAVVIALSTPYSGISTASGVVAIHDVPPGSYRLHVWSESAQSANPVDTQRIVQVGAAPVRLGEIVLQRVADPMEHHKNKFDEDYPPSRNAPY